MSNDDKRPLAATIFLSPFILLGKLMTMTYNELERTFEKSIEQRRQESKAKEDKHE
ncbi:hypothetical protein [Pseudomonas mohnii]